MNKFISCDWGTSSFRLRLIETETQNILAETFSQQGIAATYALWKNNPEDRFLFYRNVLSNGIEKLEEQISCSLNDITLIISGMASSGLGMMEMEYKVIPFKMDGSDLLIKLIEPADDFKHQIIITSGARTSEDVMRGEETIIAGCDISIDDKEHVFILPGTHSKHITITDGMITDIKTYMTGEFFDLLSTKSILSTSIKKEDVVDTMDNSNFEQGVLEGTSSNLLHAAFHVRINSLFKRLSLKENYHYLSGLLIGTELKDLEHTNYNSITLVTDGKFTKPYLHALKLLSKDKDIHHINAGKALINGQHIIYKQYE